MLLVPGSKTYMILNHWVSGQNILPGTSGSSQALMVFISLIAGLFGFTGLSEGAAGIAKILFGLFLALFLIFLLLGVTVAKKLSS